MKEACCQGSDPPRGCGSSLLPTTNPVSRPRPPVSAPASSLTDIGDFLPKVRLVRSASFTPSPPSSRREKRGRIADGTTPTTISNIALPRARVLGLLSVLRAHPECAASERLASSSSTVDLANIPLESKDLCLVAAALPVLPHVTALDMSGEGEIDKVGCELLSRLVATCTRLVRVDYRGKTFDKSFDPSRMDAVCAARASEAHIRKQKRARRRWYAENCQRHFVQCMHRKWEEHVVLQCRLLENREEVTRLRIAEGEERELLQLWGLEEWTMRAPILEREGMEECKARMRWLGEIEKPKTDLKAREAARRAVIEEGEDRARGAVHLLFRKGEREVVEHEKAHRRKLYRERHQVFVNYVQRQQELWRERVEAWEELMKVEARAAGEAYERQKARVARERRIREEEIRRQRELLAEKRREEQLFKDFLRGQRIERDKVQGAERISRGRVTAEWEEEQKELLEVFAEASKVAQAAERRGQRARERDRLNKLPPKLILECCEQRRKFFNSSIPGVITKQLWPNVKLVVQVPMLSYLRRPDEEVEVLEGEESLDEWVARKGRILGGSMLVYIDTGSAGYQTGDCIDLLSAGGVAVEGMVVTLWGKPVASIAEYIPGTVEEQHPVPKTPRKTPSSTGLTGQTGDTESALSLSLPDRSVVGVRMLLTGQVTTEDVHTVLRGFCLKRMRPPVAKGTTPTGIKVTLSISLDFPTSTTSEASVVATLTRTTVLTVVPSYLQLKMARVTFREGDPDTPFLRGVTVGPPVDLHGNVTADSWGNCTLRFKHLGVCGPRDQILLSKTARQITVPTQQITSRPKAGVIAVCRPPVKDGLRGVTSPTLTPATSSLTEEELVVFPPGKVPATCTPIAELVQRGTLFNTDHAFPAGWSATLDNTTITMHLLPEVNCARLRRLLTQLVFRNDSGDPKDGLRVIEITITDKDGEVDCAKLGIDVVAEDNLTVVNLGSSPAMFRRVVGDVLESLRSYIPVQLPERLCPQATATDVDTVYFTSGYLTALFTKGSFSSDRIGISQTDDITYHAPNLIYDGVHIGVVELVKQVKGMNSANTVSMSNGVGLKVTFSKNASIPAVQALLRSLVFSTEPADRSDAIVPSSSPERKERQPRKGGQEDVVPGFVKEGVREIDISLVVEHAEPVPARCTVKVCNTTIATPVQSQNVMYFEGGEPIKVFSKCELVTDVSTFSGGSVSVEFVEGYEEGDTLDLICDSASDFALAIGKDLERFDTGEPVEMGRSPRNSTRPADMTLAAGRRRTAAFGPNIRRGADDVVVSLVNRLRHHVPSDRKTVVKDLFYVLPSGHKALVGVVGCSESHVAIQFQLKESPGQKSPTRRRVVRRKDVVQLVRMLHFYHRGNDPKKLTKVLRLSFYLSEDDDKPSSVLVQIQVQPRNDATQITRPSAKPLIYRQYSDQDERGFFPFADCVLSDPDTDQFNRGSITVILTQGNQMCQHHSLTLEGFTVTNDGEVWQGDRQLGFLTVTTDNVGNVTLFIKHYHKAYIPIDVVQALVRGIRYSNTSVVKVRSMQVALHLTISSGFGLEGKIKLPLMVRGPIVGLEKEVREWWENSSPVAVFPSVVLNVPDRCTGDLLVGCSIADLTVRDGDEISFLFRDSAFDFRISGRQILEGSAVVGEILRTFDAPPERARKGVRMEGLVFTVSSRYLRTAIPQGLLRCLAFHTHPRGAVGLSIAPRTVELTVAVPGEDLPGSVTQQVNIVPSSDRQGVVLNVPFLTLTTHAKSGPHPVLPDVVAKATAPLSHMVVEVSGPKEGEHLLVQCVPHEVGTPELSIGGGKTLFLNSTPFATLTGNHTATLQVDFIERASSAELQAVCRSLCYVNNMDNWNVHPKRIIKVVVKTKCPIPYTISLGMYTQAPVLDVSQCFLTSDIPLRRKAHALLPKAKVNCHDFSEVVLTAHFVSAEGALQGSDERWRLGVDTAASGLLVSREEGMDVGTIMLERGKDRSRERVGEILVSASGVRLLFRTALSEFITPRIVERTVRGLQLEQREKHVNATYPSSGTMTIRVGLEVKSSLRSIGWKHASACLTVNYS
eukprot:Sspe_Gene.40239::Locus_19421_Transcript_2_4_Confidence_0.429_Length_7284::g.40239::m.40239